MSRSLRIVNTPEGQRNVNGVSGERIEALP
jgi:hypothetical protein